MDDEVGLPRSMRPRLSIARFERLRLLGRGGFGEVWLIRDRLNSDLRALKILSKAAVMSLDHFTNVCTERDILASANNPWVVTLHASFQDAENLYLLLEYVPGGDLTCALEKHASFSEPTARFFAGEIALALQSIHSLKVCHRDLKPENILIDQDGHIKLTDFGLSARYSEAESGGRAQAPIVGTPHYIAPEVLRREAPTLASDYWSLGVVLYEMLFGVPPFVGKSAAETALRIVHWRRSLRVPARGRVSAEAIDLLQHLLCDTGTRYGFDELARHPFFRGFDFANVRSNVPPIGHTGVEWATERANGECESQTMNRALAGGISV
jgi:serine/threonine protein kinase